MKKILMLAIVLVAGSQVTWAYPSYCDDPDYANTLACKWSHPEICDDPDYANTLACRGANPSYCDDPDYANSTACIPDYRAMGSSKLITKTEAPGKKVSRYPSYCDDPDYANTLACRWSHPSYCDDPDYANASACRAFRMDVKAAASKGIPIDDFVSVSPKGKVKSKVKGK